MTKPIFEKQAVKGTFEPSPWLFVYFKKAVLVTLDSFLMCLLKVHMWGKSKALDKLIRHLYVINKGPY